MTKKLLILGSLFLLLFTVGCAGQGARTDELLAQDYRQMSDQELLTYYYRINDQIARVEREGRGTSVG
ncbi:MAG: hypothetical protein IH614_08885, partial [Desulfuromonadales bacterium]|nr:hypothetical protein [Desulfuromonadales bacterium]